MAPMVHSSNTSFWGSHPTQLLSSSTALLKTPPLWDSPLWHKDSQCEKGIPREKGWGTNLIPIQETSEEQPELLGMAKDHSFPSAQICFRCCSWDHSPTNFPQINLYLHKLFSQISLRQLSKREGWENTFTHTTVCKLVYQISFSCFAERN